jgi:hypothetical protein
MRGREGAREKGRLNARLNVCTQNGNEDRLNYNTRETEMKRNEEKYVTCTNIMDPKDKPRLET